MDNFETLINEFYTSIREDTFVRLTLSKPSDETSEVKKMIIRMAIIKEKRHFSFVYRHATKDITKNLPIEEGSDKIIHLMQSEFMITNLFVARYHIAAEKLENGNFKLKKLTNTTELKTSRTHDKQKKSLLTRSGYLTALGILNSKGNIQKDKGDKYKQINKYVEVIDSLLRKNSGLDKLDPLQIVDMGSGKGYLTFALYDYLKHHKEKNVILRGIEMRSDLVDICNSIAQDSKFDKLTFEQGTIEEIKLKAIDVLIALHACDTATDDAIAKGIKAKAQLIVVAPCCHKQIRKQIPNDTTLQSIMQHGILKERQAEIVTDTIRALILQLNGYKTSVFEFISTEHTGKNVMITGIKEKGRIDKVGIQKEIDDLKKMFGIEKHHLEGLVAKQ